MITINLSSGMLKQIYKKVDNLLSCYLSDIPKRCITADSEKDNFSLGVQIRNTDTTAMQYYSFSGFDLDGDEIAGWNFKSNTGQRLLLIND